jgi:hypothetical protein
MRRLMVELLHGRPIVNTQPDVALLARHSDTPSLEDLYGPVDGLLELLTAINIHLGVRFVKAQAGWMEVRVRRDRARRE